MIDTLALKPEDAPERDFRRAGCGEGCRVLRMIRPGVFGRQELLVHDPDAHEMYGRILAGDRSAAMVLETGLLSIDRATLEIRVDGQPKELPGKALALLLVLANDLGRVVPYRRLIRRVWGDEYAEARSPSLISTTLSRVRGALGPDAAGLIETRVDVGLRLRDVEVGRATPLESPGGRGQRWAKAWDACRVCGERTYGHATRGFCYRSACYAAYEQLLDVERARRGAS